MLLEDGSIRVMDFGIARLTRSETRTITDKAIGSVHYISPEQAKGDTIDSRADLYSVGIMMYQLLTGKLPFEADTPVKVAAKQITDEAVRPREILPDIPKRLEEITLNAMVKDPARRYQSASQMLRDIDEFKRNQNNASSYNRYLPTGSDNTDKVKAETNADFGHNSDEPLANGYRGIDKNEPLPIQSRSGITRHPKRVTYLVVGFVSTLVISVVVFAIYLLNGVNGSFPDIETPDFRNMKYEDIKSNPEYRNFRFRIVEDYRAGTEIGVIYDQNPLPGKQIKSNSEITLYISLGGKDIVLTDVVGLPSGEAKEILTKLGVKVKMETDSDLNFEPNAVIRMRPKAGSVVFVGEEVVIVVNALVANNESLVPDLIGKRLAEAQVLLSQNNLNTGKITYKDDPSPKGTIIEQNPKADEKVPSNTSVDLVISSGPLPRGYQLKFSIPSGPDNGMGANNSYDVMIRVNGEDYASFTNGGGSLLEYTAPVVNVLSDNTIIDIYLVYAGNYRLYLSYTAQITTESCILTGGIGTSNEWPWLEDNASSLEAPPAALPNNTKLRFSP